MENKIIVFSGIQPSGSPTLGNYVGAVRNWSLLQSNLRYCYYCVVDLHAITVRQDPAILRRRSIETIALILAAGIDPEKSTLFIQSNVKAHAQLSWVLSCYTYMGELNRMTQFKDKSAKHSDNINAGLYTYPVLMASDILLYQSDLVPVGSDQKQHVEIARDIALRFNKACGETFKVPEPYIPKIGGRIMSLQDPLKKMSKSDENEMGYIAIMDTPEIIMKKFKRAVTDSENRIVFSPEEKPGVSNLLSLYGTFAGKTAAETENIFSGLGYGQLKVAVAEAVIEELIPIQKRYKEILDNKEYLDAIIVRGAEKAAAAADKTLSLVYERVGFNSFRV
ncbi:MAG: tryptophan--tRNA ligase [Clostridia bacterium]